MDICWNCTLSHNALQKCFELQIAPCVKIQHGRCLDSLTVNVMSDSKKIQKGCYASMQETSVTPLSQDIKKIRRGNYGDLRQKICPREEWTGNFELTKKLTSLVAMCGI